MYGVPYLFGGQDPTIGLDCSGFVVEVFHCTGVHLADNTAAGLHQMCAAVDQPEPGDLIFFTAPDTVGTAHVGIVKDPSRHVMMDSHKGTNRDGVGETDYSQPYWVTHFLGFGRLPMN